MGKINFGICKRWLRLLLLVLRLLIDGKLLCKNASVAFGVLRQGGLLENAYDIKVLVLQENSLAFEVGADKPLLLFDWL